MRPGVSSINAMSKAPHDPQLAIDGVLFSDQDLGVLATFSGSDFYLDWHKASCVPTLPLPPTEQHALELRGGGRVDMSKVQ